MLQYRQTAWHPGQRVPPFLLPAGKGCLQTGLAWQLAPHPAWGQRRQPLIRTTGTSALKRLQFSHSWLPTIRWKSRRNRKGEGMAGGWESVPLEKYKSLRRWLYSQLEEVSMGTWEVFFCLFLQTSLPGLASCQPTSPLKSQKIFALNPVSSLFTRSVTLGRPVGLSEPQVPHLCIGIVVILWDHVSESAL